MPYRVSSGGGGGPGDLVLFKWNEVDFTQFGAPVGTIVGGTITPSVVTVLGVPRIRFALSVFQGQAFYEILNLNLAVRYILLHRFYQNTATPAAADNIVWLHTTNLVTAMTVTDLFGVQFPMGTGSSGYRMEAGVRITAGTPAFSGLSNPDSEVGLLEETTIVRGPDPNSGDPDFSIVNIGTGNTSSRQDSYAANQYGAYNAGWDGLTLDKIGIGMSTTNALTGNVEIGELEILKHPMDY